MIGPRPLNLAPVNPLGSELGGVAEVGFDFLRGLGLPLEASIVTSESRICVVLNPIGFGGLLAGLEPGVLLLDEEGHSSFSRGWRYGPAHWASISKIPGQAH